MKSVKHVEATRRDYHRDPCVNSVHRASLTVPEIDGAVADISFLNHFLVKHGYENVACRITGIAPDGRRIESRLQKIAEPRVYTIPLTGMFDDKVGTYLVEFFSADNLFFPYPAVMVNHRGPRFLNEVHGFNRVLNDIFEEDTINDARVAEASIDAMVGDDAETFVAFASGPQPVDAEIEFEFATVERNHRATIKLEQPRLNYRYFSLSSVFPELRSGSAGVLKVWQPPQILFFGRMLTGMRHKDGAISANHSYYDSSEVEEYWDDDRPSTRSYPYFNDLQNIERIYPIMSKSRLEFSIGLHDMSGRRLADAEIGELESPGSSYLDISVNDIIAQLDLDHEDVGSYELTARPTQGNTPTRIGHQLVYSGGGLASSINLALTNPNLFVPGGKNSFAWGQLAVGGGVETWLGLLTNRPEGDPCDVEVTFYSDAGEIARRHWRLSTAGALRFNVGYELAPEIDEMVGSDTRYLWYVARTSRPDLSAYTVIRHGESLHCTGEHYF